MTTLSILRTKADKVNFFIDALFGSLFIMVAIGALEEMWFLHVVVGYAVINHYVYSRVDFILNITFQNHDDGLHVRFMGIRWPLSRESSFVMIEDIKLFNRFSFGPKYGLVLRRNVGSRWHRLFKNRIKLYYGSVEMLQAEMQAIHEVTGLRFADFIEEP